MSSYNLDNLYGHRFYIRPERLCWEPWFAWHPVQLIYWCDEYPMQEYPIKLGRVVWLSQLLRRRVIDHQLSGQIKNLVDVDRDIQLGSLSAMRGRWTDVMLHVRFSSTDGLAEPFVNGSSRGKIQGKLIRVPVDHFMMKYGIYRAFVSQYKSVTGKTMPTQIVYFDEVRVGARREDVDLQSASLLIPID